MFRDRLGWRLDPGDAKTIPLQFFNLLDQKPSVTLTHNPLVGGSSPPGPTILLRSVCNQLEFLLSPDCAKFESSIENLVCPLDLRRDQDCRGQCHVTCGYTLGSPFSVCPSTAMICPEIFFAALELKNTAVSAMSSADTKVRIEVASV